MAPKINNVIRLFGIFLVIFSIMINPFVIEKLFSSYQQFDFFWKYVAIFFCGLILFSLGLLFYFETKLIMNLTGSGIKYCNPIFLYNNRKKELLLFIISSLVTLIACDITLSFILPPAYQKTEYGWTVTENFEEIRFVQDHPGYWHYVNNKYFQYGFKRWGNLKTDKTKILILGDSWTQAAQVSNGKEWYAYLEKELPEVEFFVYGSSGYGSLQEFLVLDDYIDLIDPDVIIWQFCGNDYVNNAYQLDRKTFPYNNHVVRPYLENNKIVYRLPLLFPELRKHSVIIDYSLRNLEDELPVNKEYMRYWFWRKKLFFSPEEIEQSFLVTLDIMSMVKARAGERPVFLFEPEILDKNELLICEKTGIICLADFSRHMADIENKGYYIHMVTEHHWNEIGQQYAGEYLSKILKNNSIFKEFLNAR